MAKNDRVWEIIDEAEFQLCSLKGELKRLSPTAIAMTIVEQRDKLLEALRIVRGMPL